MALFSKDERRFARLIQRLGYCNPFLPVRGEIEREILGDDFQPADSSAAFRPDAAAHSPNTREIVMRVQRLAEVARLRLERSELGERTAPRTDPGDDNLDLDNPKTKSQTSPGDDDFDLYETLVLFLLYHRFYDQFRLTAVDALRSESTRAEMNLPQTGRSDTGRSDAARSDTGRAPTAPFFKDFLAALRRFFDGCEAHLFLPASVQCAPSDSPDASIVNRQSAIVNSPDFRLTAYAAHAFACFFQICRAFIHIFESLVGDTAPIGRLRAAVWQSIFTHDMRRYRRVLFDRMTDIACLITGPSGTGKELVARAIGLSRYIPFDPNKRAFAERFAASFFPLNIAALPATLIESELFGHRRGAFTGAVQERAGWLELCPPLGSVFLDEIGDLDGAIQVKLLRVLQARVFQRLGDTRDRLFHGKIIAATNRDLARAMREGNFREDLYYRLCSDIIRTPTLREQVADAPEAVEPIVRFLAARLVGEDEAEPVACETLDWIARRLGPGYPWPGNVRELEQCVRNVLVRREYEPVAMRDKDGKDFRDGRDHTDADDMEDEGEKKAGADSRNWRRRLIERMEAADMTAEELLRVYCTLAYARTNNYQETARRLDLDHRTIKSRIDPDLLRAL